MTSGPDITWAELQELVTEALKRNDNPEPARYEPELSVFDVLSGHATWDEFDALRLAG